MSALWKYLMWGVAFIALADAAQALAGEVQAPELMLVRHFPQGGTESLSVGCREDRTRDTGWVCEVARLRNGMEVFSVFVEYERVRQGLEKFFGQVNPRRQASVEGIGGHPLLSWSAAHAGRKVRGTLLRESKESHSAEVKALLALEGSLIAEFYR